MPETHTPNGSARSQVRGGWRVGRGDRHAGDQAVPSASLLAGEVRATWPPPSLRSATAVLTATRGKGVDRMPPHVSRLSAERLAERGARSAPSGGRSAAPDWPGGGRTGLPMACLPTGNVTTTASATPARLGRWSLGGMVFRAVGGSSDHDRLAVMHQPIEGGGGLWVSKRETGGPHRGCRRADSPVPN